MKSGNNTTKSIKLLCVLLVIASVAEASETAAEFIKEAHKYDNMYTLGPDTSQEKAIDLYNKALKAKPSDDERLHILFRTAQLYGSSYQVEKGEKPDYYKAIGIYEKIVEAYPPDEPRVLKAMSSISDHYITLHKFEEALTWAKKAVKHDTTETQKQVKAAAEEAFSFVEQQEHGHLPEEQSRQIEEQIKRAERLEKNVARIEEYRLSAVAQVAESAEFIDPLRAHGELRAISIEQSGTAIGERAAALLSAHMDKHANLWAPDESLPFSSDGTALRADTPDSTGMNHKEDQVAVKSRLDSAPGTDKGRYSTEPNATETLQHGDYAANQPRDSPLAYIIPIAGLAALGLAAAIIRKKPSTKGLKK